jgi:quercetin dioxygenase-like cupin family protein
MERKRAEIGALGATEGPPGVFRTTLSYNAPSMICHFRLDKDARIPLHHHEAVQHGYVLRGRICFLGKNGSSFEARPGTSYVFDPWEEHGAEVLEDSEVLEFFAPMRPEYADN